MEFVAVPVLILILLRYAMLALVLWFIDHFVEPRAALNILRDANASHPMAETTNAERAEKLRIELDQLRERMEAV